MFALYLMQLLDSDNHALVSTRLQGEERWKYSRKCPGVERLHEVGENVVIVKTALVHQQSDP